MSGWGTWARTILPVDGRVWLGGRRFDNWLEVEGGALSVSGTEGVRAIRSHAGTSAIYGYYRGEDAPLVSDWKSFGTGFLADSEEDYVAFERLRSLGRAVQFFPGDYVTDTFEAVSGRTYTLSRYPANGIVPTIEDEDFPITVALDGTNSPGSATIDGRSVVASDSGLLSVMYAPVYSVLLEAVTKTFSETLQLVISCTLTEERA